MHPIIANRLISVGSPPAGWSMAMRPIIKTYNKGIQITLRQIAQYLQQQHYTLTPTPPTHTHICTNTIQSTTSSLLPLPLNHTVMYTSPIQTGEYSYQQQEQQVHVKLHLIKPCTTGDSGTNVHKFGFLLTISLD